MVKVPSRSSIRRALAFFSVAAFLLVPALLPAYSRHLSEDDVREAYFFGQRHDLRVAKFFDAYEKKFRPSANEPSVRAIGVRTPYGAAVLRSYQAGSTYSEQRAWKDYTERERIFEVVIWIDIPAGNPLQQANALDLTLPLLKLFTVKLSSQERILASRKTVLVPQYFGGSDSSVLTGAEMHFEYDVQDVASAMASIQVTSQTEKTVTAEFDLAGLR
jgi:hypothetical protein